MSISRGAGRGAAYQVRLYRWVVVLPFRCAGVSAVVHPDDQCHSVEVLPYRYAVDPGVGRPDHPYRYEGAYRCHCAVESPCPNAVR
ncbi:hypothetical protein GCM10028773_31840 [Spirosoma koreense]